MENRSRILSSDCTICTNKSLRTLMLLTDGRVPELHRRFEPAACELLRMCKIRAAEERGWSMNRTGYGQSVMLSTGTGFEQTLAYSLGFFSFFNIASDFKESIIRFHRRLMHENLPLLSQFWMATKAIVSKFKMYVLNLWESVRLFAAMTCVILVFLPPESWRQMRHLIWTQGIKCGVYPLISTDFFAK